MRGKEIKLDEKYIECIIFKDKHNMRKFSKTQFIILILIILVSGLFASGAQYLIIVRDNFFQTVQPLAQWKNKKGIETRVVKLSEIGGNNPVAIKNYISDVYNRWNPKPEYVLLVGDINYITPYPHPNCGPTDNAYADVNNDTLLELCIGRLPARSTSQLRSMINKIFSYERTPYLSDTLWYRKAVTVRQDPGPYHNAGVHFVRSMILDNSDFVQVDTLVVPTNSRRDLKDTLAQGRSYFLYTGHGGGANWVSPFNISLPVKNGRKYPIIFSWSCQTVLQRNYLGQKWLKSGTVRLPKGAVAFIGTTTSGLYAPYRNYVGRNFFRAIFQYKALTIGKALKQGLDSLWTYTPDNFGHTLYNEWNILGDPELNLWTAVPRPMIVTFESILPMGQQTFSLLARNDNGQAIPDASICLMMPNDSSFYYHGYTDKYGVLSFNINPKLQDSVWVTVTAQNYIPYEGNCFIVSSNLMTYPIDNNKFVNKPWQQSKQIQIKGSEIRAENNADKLIKKP